MARNIEIKARIERVEALAPRVAKIANEGPTEIFQDDTFFNAKRAAEASRVFSKSRRTHFLQALKSGRAERIVLRSLANSRTSLIARGGGGADVGGDFKKRSV